MIWEIRKLYMQKYRDRRNVVKEEKKYLLFSSFLAKDRIAMIFAYSIDWHTVENSLSIYCIAVTTFALRQVRRRQGL